MKRMFFLPMGAVALLLAFTACSEELIEVPSSTLKQIVMTAVDFETENESRTNFQITSAGAEFSWAANDTVGIFPNEGAQAYFPMTSGAGTKSANFTGGGWALKDASTYAAYYPFIGNFYLNKNAIPVDFTGQVQTGDASTAHLGAYDYMAAIPVAPKNGNVNFAFKHLGALVQLKLTVPQATIFNSVALTAESNAFAVKGTVDVMVSAPSITPVTAVKEVNLELNELATTEANQIVTLYMMLPPVDLSAKTLKAVVKTSYGTEEVALESKNFQAGKAYALNGILENKGDTQRTVKIETAGTMKNLLGDDYLNITSLKIVGPINGDDVYYLRKMLGGSDFSEADWGKLTTLDLSEATIVEGGEWYYDDSLGNKYYTSNNTIGAYMFYGSNLQNLVWPKKISTVGTAALEWSRLSSIYIDNLLEWCNIDFGPSNRDLSYKLFLNGEELTEFVVPNEITKIKSYAFRGCQNIKNIIIHNDVTSIGYEAFRNCDALTSITIPNNVTSIYWGAFSYCDSLKSVVIGNGITELPDNCFRDCKALASVVIGKNVETIGRNAFDEVAISVLYSYATIPPTINTGSYYNRSFNFVSWDSKRILYVPSRCGTKYKSSDWGFYFENIIEMD